MAESIDPRFLDKRTLERYLRNGQLDEKAFERHVKGLPDLADRTAIVETQMADAPDESEAQESPGDGTPSQP
jgi:hypothetical protein